MRPWQARANLVLGLFTLSPGFRGLNLARHLRKNLPKKGFLPG